MQRVRFYVVTEENVSNSVTDDLVSDWLALIEKRILECGVELPQACELFVELRSDELPHVSTCAYYFVDHHSRCLFWLEPTSSELLDMGMLISDSHLGVFSFLPFDNGLLTFNRYCNGKTLLGACGIFPDARLCTDDATHLGQLDQRHVSWYDRYGVFFMEHLCISIAYEMTRI